MNILSEIFILAAGDDGPLGWIVPVVFVSIWIIGGIGKVIATAREDRKQREKQRSVPGQPDKKMRYKPIPDGSSPQRRERAIPQAVPVQRVRETETMPSADRVKPEPKRPGAVASLKKAMQDAMQDVYAQQTKRQAPKQAPARKPKKVQRQTTRKVPTPAKPVAKSPVKQVEVMPQEGSILKELLVRENIRKAIIYSEILGKPLALRQQ
jgi:hypothetical protein